MRKLKLLTEEQFDYFKEHQYLKYSKEIAEEMNSKFGLNLTPKQISDIRGNHGINSGLTGQFEKGLVPHNKGKKYPGKVNSGSFKKGQKSINKVSVGTIRCTNRGYWEVKIADPDKWKLVHRVLWECEYGEIPKGNVVIFKDQNKNNLSLENLICVTRQELVQLNKRRKITEHADVTEANVNVLRLERLIKHKLEYKREIKNE